MGRSQKATFKQHQNKKPLRNENKEGVKLNNKWKTIKGEVALQESQKVQGNKTKSTRRKMEQNPD